MLPPPCFIGEIAYSVGFSPWVALMDQMYPQWENEYWEYFLAHSEFSQWKSESRKHSNLRLFIQVYDSVDFAPKLFLSVQEFME